MPAPSESDLRLEIGHVLLIDIVGYSKLLITEQRERLETLNEIVRNSEQFRVSDANGMLVRIPTGDGMALIFRDTVEAPVRRYLGYHHHKRCIFHCGYRRGKG